MKKNVSILIAVIVIIGVSFLGYTIIKKNKEEKINKEVEKVEVKNFTGKVVRVFEGDNTLEYSFDIPKDSFATTSMEDSLIRVSYKEMPYATIYFSYEGGRGFSPVDYIGEIISPHVSVINLTGTTTLGSNIWQTAESNGSEWHIAPVLNSQWLMVVESKKHNHDGVLRMLNSVVIK